METKEVIIAMIDQSDKPAFVIANGRIIYANATAANLNFKVGMTPDDIFGDYIAFYRRPWTSINVIYVSAGGMHFPAHATKIDGYEVFTLVHAGGDSELKALGMAASMLKFPMFDVHNSIDSSLNPELWAMESSKNFAYRSIHRLHRLICNMEDADKYRNHMTRKHVQDICKVTDEIMTQVRTVSDRTSIRITCKLPTEPVYCALDADHYEKAFLNLLAESLAAEAENIEILLEADDKTVWLHVTDDGRAIPAEVRMNCLNNYLSTQDLVDLQLGLRLGMIIVHACAINHGGSMTMSLENGSDVRFTVSLTRATESEIRNIPKFLQVDTSGGLNRTLVACSDCLPETFYDENS